MASVAHEAVLPEQAATELRVGWVGDRPAWLELDGAIASLEGLEITSPDAATTVVHLAGGSAAKGIGRRRRRSPGSRVVLDLSREWAGGRSLFATHRTRLADLVLLGTLAELREFRRRRPALATRSAVFRQPVDLDRHAPLKRLHEQRDAHVKRFRRLHRLAGPMVLFAGPYTEAGGLDLVLEAVYRLRDHLPELRLAAVPHGPVDQRYVDRCERRALALGHHGIVEWAPSPDDLPLWYGLATVVCTPARSAVDPTPAKLAAAAARPFVGSDIEPITEHVSEGRTGFLVESGDLDVLTAALEVVLGDTDAASELGAAGRHWAEEELSPEAAGRRLRRLWLEAARDEAGDRE